VGRVRPFFAYGSSAGGANCLTKQLQNVGQGERKEGIESGERNGIRRIGFAEGHSVVRILGGRSFDLENCR
jgi:hypothetical protein